MDKQGGMPEKVVTFRRPENQGTSPANLGGSIKNFQNPTRILPETTKPISISSVATGDQPPTGIVEGLSLQEPINIGDRAAARRQALNMATKAA